MSFATQLLTLAVACTDTFAHHEMIFDGRGLTLIFAGESLCLGHFFKKLP